MTQDEKQLLLKDICARLPYGVKCYAYQYKIDGNHCECYGTFDGILNGYFYLSDRVSVNDGKTYDEHYLEVKPYLRPMSSMTPQEWCDLCDCELEDDKAATIVNGRRFVSHVNEENFLNSNHFDFRGLIEKGLALEAPEGMYKVE